MVENRINRALTLDRVVLLAFTVVEIDEVGLPIRENLLADAVKPILTPAALVLTAVVQQLDALTMPLSALVLAQVFVVIAVVTETKSLHLTVLKHSFVDEPIIVEQGSDAVDLVVAVDLPVVEPILHLQADEVFL